MLWAGRPPVQGPDSPVSVCETAALPLSYVGWSVVYRVALGRGGLSRRAEGEMVRKQSPVDGMHFAGSLNQHQVCYQIRDPGKLREIWVRGAGSASVLWAWLARARQANQMPQGSDSGQLASASR